MIDLIDTRILGFLDADAPGADKVAVGDFRVSPLSDVPDGMLPSEADGYHMYAVLGAHSSSRTGHVTVLFSRLDPQDELVVSDPSKRYLIIADHASGKRLRVELPAV